MSSFQIRSFLLLLDWPQLRPREVILMIIEAQSERLGGDIDLSLIGLSIFTSTALADMLFEITPLDQGLHLLLPVEVDLSLIDLSIFTSTAPTNMLFEVTPLDEGSICSFRLK